MEKIITSIIQLQTKKKRNVLDDILTIYENYVVRKVSNEGFSNKVDEVTVNLVKELSNQGYSIDNKKL
mgnify:FL=1